MRSPDGAVPGGVVAVVLAAGSSSRLGRPKALLDFDGRTALGLVLGALRAAALTRGVVVVGEHGAALAAAIDPRPFAFVPNPDPAAGRTGSLQVGLADVPDGDDVLLWPVDRPFAKDAVVRALVAARRAAPDDVGWIVPTARGRRGHPVLLRAAVLPAIRVAAPSDSLRDVLRASGRRVLDVETGDDGIHPDLDTEESVAAARAWWRARRA